MVSDRLPPRTDVNPLSHALAALRARGANVLDLTESNPTTVGIQYPRDLLCGFADPRALVYAPHPRGLEAARAAVAEDCSRRGAVVDPSDVLLCASTSEAYSWLFKLLCSPGDVVLVPQPSYPLFEHLTRLEGVRGVPYELRYHGRWEVDFDAVARAPETTRAVLVVSPNNPTGSFISQSELDRLTGVCATRGWALIADEVFADYTLDESHPVTDLATRAGVLSFTLAGASKTLGLPQVKLGWIVVGGPPGARLSAIASLELIADTYLSVSTPVQVAAPALLRDAATVRTAIHARVRRNLSRARDIARAYPWCTVLRVDGGWSAPVRVPAVASEESMVLSLLEREHVLVHPGYFFDFPHEAFFVVSLLPDETAFANAFDRSLRFLAGMK
jgi:aspartate/methionine/tyrosine aminotransferase